jgi:hypothetical protein
MVCARTAVTPSVRMNVVLPDMFEPVTRMPCGGPIVIEFGTAVSTSGWRTAVKAAGDPAGRNRGRVKCGEPVRNDAMLMAASTSPTAAITRRSAAARVWISLAAK